MAEQTFKSPNFYEREIDLSVLAESNPTGTPLGVVGTSKKGPAFVPVTVGNYDQFVSRFGDLDVKKNGPYAANEWLKHKSALTYLRVLGAGSNASETDIEETRQTDRVKNAGFKLDGVAAPGDTIGRHAGCVQFISAVHTIQSEESTFPLFTNNDSIVESANKATLLRAMIMTPETSRVMIIADPEVTETFTGNKTDESTIVLGTFSGKFKIAISSSLGSTFWTDENKPGVKIFTASLDPSSDDYIAKVLNTDPEKFIDTQHYLYADFPVDSELAVAEGAIAVLSGSNATSTTSGDTALQMRKAFGSFDARYRAPSTPWFISQPYGTTEYDLFKFESVDDGSYANTLYKISITDLKASVDESDLFGTFTVQVRDWNDTDLNPRVLESFNNCTLNQRSTNYIARVIGDFKARFNFDAELDSEKRIVFSGKYPNRSKYVRVVMNEQVDRGLIPQNSLPFGFRGHEILKTNELLTDDSSGAGRLTGNISTAAVAGGILPPIPFRVKVTKGDNPAAATWLGEPGNTETSLSLFYWGVKFERNTDPLNPNVASEKNKLLENYAKFMGITKLDVLVTGSGADTFNNNKFSLSKVALSATSVNNVTGSVSQHMRETAYIRNGVVDPSSYAIDDGVLGKRLTLASLLNSLSASEFNRFSPYTKFTTFMQGGWDGLNILDKNAQYMNDRSTSFDTGACAAAGYTSPGFSVNFCGESVDNSAVNAYKTGVNILTDSTLSRCNLIMLPGIRESYITDYASKKTKDYGLALYVMDVPSYDDSGARIFDDMVMKPSVERTCQSLDSRVIDNSYAATYFPDVYINDAVNSRRVNVPASVAIAGAIGYNDKVGYPWFAPAGFNRAALDFVTNSTVRLSAADRDRLSESRVNPIALFPRAGYVVYGQKTLQIGQTALNRVNVRRLMNEVKRIIVNIAKNMVFEQNDQSTRNKFVSDAQLQLSLIKAQSGVDSFSVVMNETNNSTEDARALRANGRVVIVPVRSIENIAIDYIITNSGVQFL
jgi:hypothetical protein